MTVIYKNCSLSDVYNNNCKYENPETLKLDNNVFKNCTISEIYKGECLVEKNNDTAKDFNLFILQWVQNLGQAPQFVHF